METNQQDAIYLAQTSSRSLGGAAAIMLLMTGPYMNGMAKTVADMGVPQPWKGIALVVAVLSAIAFPMFFSFVSYKLSQKIRALPRL
jgi:hypothetical protein